jgi:valyl-tRNA synthetase
MDQKYIPAEQEPLLQQLWAVQKVYTTQDQQKPVVSVDTPPPTVSGTLHLGHLFSYTQTDLSARYKRMQGNYLFYPMGFDDNGLPTERFVEKQLGITAHSVGRSEFIRLCLDETQKVETQFQALWERIGLSIDWRHTYSTISHLSRTVSQASFIELYKKGFVYRQFEPSLYCTTCRTTIAQAELEDIEKPSIFYTINFSTPEGKVYPIGTTRPELISSCVALLYNPADTRYTHLAGKTMQVPLFNHTVPVLADEAVVMDKGTGLVMVSTFGDKTDVQWFKKYKLPYKPSIGHDGKWLESTGFLAGLKADQAREAIVKALSEVNLIINQQPIAHAVNVHERCKKPIEYLALSQWFLQLLPYKKELLAQADAIEWYPAFMKTRYQNWVESLSWDWCLSRQRIFGIPFPAWHCNNCKAILLAEREQLPLDPQETPYGKPCPQCASTDITPDTDVMDTWNTSSLTPFICAQLYNPASDIFSSKNSFMPMTFRPQAHDIIRTWAFYTIVKAWMHLGTIPWKQIVISGHVLSDTKEKLSKSKDNARTSPQALIDTYSADVLRYWTATGTLGTDTAFSETQLKIGQRLITKLWNACRFIEQQVTTPVTKPTHFDPLNSWLLTRLSATKQKYHAAFSTYDHSGALDAVERFLWHDFCDNYLELIKDQFFKPERYTQEIIDTTKWCLSYAGFQMLQLFAPFIPFVTEKIYQELYKAQYNTPSLHATVFDDFTYTNTPDSELIAHILEVTAQIRMLKTQKQASLKQPIAVLNIQGVPDHQLPALEKLAPLLSGIAHAATLAFSTMQSKDNGLQIVDQQWHVTLSLNPEPTHST